MIRLNDGPNDIYVTINEKGSGDYYILRVVDNMDINVESLCILGENISPDVTRYDKFELNVGTWSGIDEGVFVAMNENGFAWNSLNGFDWATHSAATGNEIKLTYLSEIKRLLRAKRKGRSSTVLSSSSGVTDEASVSKKTLLGA